MNMRGHDLRRYDNGDPNSAERWVGRSDDSGTTWPPGDMRPLRNASSPGHPMHFGGDCFGDMSVVPAVPDLSGYAVSSGADEQEGWLAADKELLVMSAIYHTGSQGVSAAAMRLLAQLHAPHVPHDYGCRWSCYVFSLG